MFHPAGCGAPALVQTFRPHRMGRDAKRRTRPRPVQTSALHIVPTALMSIQEQTLSAAPFCGQSLLEGPMVNGGGLVTADAARLWVIGPRVRPYVKT
jgi:hypothetical protein